MADVVLVPGLWLNGSSWEPVARLLEQAGHHAHPVTLPGTEDRSSDRSRVTLADHVDAIVRAVDAAGDPVVVVGHSAGAGLVNAAVDARADRIARAVYVGGFPTRSGEAIGADLPGVDGEIPLLDWSDFDDADVADLDEPARRRFRDAAIPFPQQVMTEPLRLLDDRRFDVPVTLLCPEFDPDDVRTWIAEGEPGLGELAMVRDLDLVDLPTGHWPQLSAPSVLARALLDVLGAASD